ncbi:hypothetical protein HYH03_000737 [Edaphochlamys debaryana]|uniref:Sister chromatid cohesion protein n=1 Tax=Edaphochlamys debaryana TaxID=47281 RepID=A0A835YJS3_9CHLO|nr:hypothetical protein HYH03_000737 [Edaphochlamys debaryana]|eukprot:KAG2502251.1 hypothetical protein HYH03_000737 [Edaphochlamys debaryana]
MAGPRYKLDLVSYDDPGALLPMPMPAEPSRSALLPPDSEALDLRLAQDATLVDLLSDVLQKADISFVQPISMDAATAVSREQLASTSHLAARLLAHQPLHFQYGTIDVEPPATGPVPATPVAATPGPSGGLAVAAHNSQPDTQPHSKRRKTDPEEVPAAEKKRQRKAPKQDVYVMSGEEADIAAGKLASSLEATLAAAARAAEEGGSDDEGDDEDEEQQHDDEEGGDGRGRRRQGQPGPPCRFSLAALQALHREMRTGQAQGLLRLLPTPLLQALLRALGQAVAAGRDRVLRDDAEAKSRAVQRVSRALEAVLCALVVLSSPGLPTSLYMEELLGDAVGLAQHCLQLNVLALHDPRFKRMYRPGELEEGAGGLVGARVGWEWKYRGQGRVYVAKEEETKTKTSRRGRPAAAPGMFIPRWCGGLVAQLEQALGLLAEVVAIKCVPAEGLIPLARASQQALTVEALSTMHYRALGLAVAMFRFYPAQRHVVVEELVQGVSTDPPVRIQMVAALVMQLVQAAPELPAADAGAQAAAACANPASSWADFLWGAVLARLPGAKAAKQETHADLRAWLEAVVEDLLAALCLPEWPAAGVLLRRLILALNGEGGMKSPDSGARLAALDLLGLLARSLWGLARAAEAPEAARAVLALVDEALASAGGAQPAPPVPPRLVAEQLVLEHLADAAHSGAPAAELPHSHHGHHHSGAASSSSSAHLASSSGSAGSGPVASARTLLACSMLADSIRGWRQAHADKMPGEKVANEAILRHRQIYDRQRSCLGASTSGLPHLSRESAVGVCRWLVAESMLGRSRPTLVRWLAEVGGSGRSRQEAHAANVRSKAIKLLGGVIEVDVRVLSLNDVQEGIKNALADDSVLVREAAVDLIGKHISRSSELAVQYYDILVRASEDTGLTVRKRAIKLLWECCVRCPDFKHRSDALMRIVSRATDPEDTMRAAVTKICAEIWFLPRFHLDDDDEGSAIARDPRQRAAQLGEVVATVYRALGPAHPVPFTASMPVVATIRGIVGEEGRPEVEAVRSGAREVADALLERALELQGEPDPAPGDAAGTPAAPGSLPLPPGEELFQALLALHALAAADVRLLLRPRDPQRVELPSAGPPGSDPSAAKRRAEQLLAVLAVLGCCVGALRHLDEGLADEIVGDLKAIALKVTHVQVVSVACQCLCALAGLKPRHRATVRELAGGLYSFLEGDRAKQVTANPERRRMYPRFMYTLGMLCRYGADMLDEAVEGSKHPSCASALELVLRMYSLLGDSARHQEAALQAMGNIFIARPSLAVDVREVRPVLEGALAPSAPAALKCRCLGSLAELLRAEEEALVGRQAAARREAKDAGQASTAPEAEAKALARRNGEGDTGSVSSGLIQMLWERVLALATDVTPTPAPGPSASGQTPPATPNGTGSQNPGATVRRRALDLVEVVIRGGIVVPWSAMPALTALATDPERDTAARALGCLRAVVAANTAFVAGQVPAGVAEAYAFHCRLAALERPGQPPQPDKCAPLVEGLAAVWTAVFGVERALKAKFLAALLKPLDDGCCLASGSAAKSDPHLLAFLAYVVAELPYRKMDELLALLGRINEILSRRAEAVLGRFQQLRQDESEGGDKANGGGPGASTPVAGGGPRASAANGLPATVRAAYAVSLLLLLKQYLRLSYDLTADRVAKYDPSGPQRKVEEKLNAVHNGKLRFNASRLRADVAAAVGPHPHGHGQAPGGSRAAKVSTPSGPTAAAAGAGAGAGASTPSASRQGPGAGAEANGAGPSAAGPPPGLLGEDALRAGVSEVFKVLRTLMKTDEMDYKQAVAAAAAAEEAAVVQGSPGEGAQGLDVAAMMAAPDSVQGGKPPLATKGRGRGRGRGSRGGAAGAAGTRGGRGTRGGGARGAAGGRGRGRGRGRKRKADSDEEDEEDEEEDEDEEGADEEGTPKKPKRSAGSTRRRLVE